MQTQTVVDARKTQMGREEALNLARSVDVVLSTRNGKLLHLEPKTAKEEDLLSAMLGPTGNLRAPTIRSGKTLLVGFDESVYKQVIEV